MLLAAPPSVFAPTTQDLDQVLERVERHVAHAEKADEAWGSAQWAWVEAGERRCRPTAACARRVAEARALARDARRFAQAARAEWLRAERMRSFHPLDTLVRGERARRWTRLARRVEDAALAYVRRLDWHQRSVEPWARWFPGPVAEADCELQRESSP